MKYRHYNDMNVWSFLSVHKKSCSKYFYMIDSIIILWKQGFVNPNFLKNVYPKHCSGHAVKIFVLYSLYCVCILKLTVIYFYTHNINPNPQTPS